VEHETPSGACGRHRSAGSRHRGDLAACGAGRAARTCRATAATCTPSWPARPTSLEPVVVLAHIDTVHPIGTLAARPFRIEDGRAYGPGIYDMKTGLALRRRGPGMAA
jgi:glutamate carboxypeptidase